MLTEAVFFLVVVGMRFPADFENTLPHVPNKILKPAKLLDIRSLYRFLNDSQIQYYESLINFEDGEMESDANESGANE